MVGKFSVHSSQVAHQAGAYPGFISEATLDGMLVQSRVTIKWSSTHLYTWVKRGTMRVKYLSQEHNEVPRQDSNKDRPAQNPAH